MIFFCPHNLSKHCCFIHQAVCSGALTAWGDHPECLYTPTTRCSAYSLKVVGYRLATSCIYLSLPSDNILNLTVKDQHENHLILCYAAFFRLSLHSRWIYMRNGNIQGRTYTPAVCKSESRCTGDRHNSPIKRLCNVKHCIWVYTSWIDVLLAVLP